MIFFKKDELDDEIINIVNSYKIDDLSYSLNFNNKKESYFALLFVIFLCDLTLNTKLIFEDKKKISDKLIENFLKFSKNKNIFDKSYLQLLTLTLSALYIVDDKYYEKFTKKYSINFNLRPKYLSKSKSKSIDVVLNLLNKLEKNGKYFDNVILLQTTSPFRTNDDIEKAYNNFIKNKLDSIVSVCYSNFKNNQVVFENPENIINNNFLLKNKKKILLINGAIYIASVKFLKKNNKFFGGKKSEYYVMKQSLSTDLDSNFDLYLAKKLLKNKYKLNKFDLYGN